MRIKRATAEQRAAYAEDRTNVYPLYGYLHDGEHAIAIEDLRKYWSKPDPQYELRAPAGYTFTGEDTHGKMAYTLADILDVYCGVERCTVKGCECYNW